MPKMAKNDPIDPILRHIMYSWYSSYVSQYGVNWIIFSVGGKSRQLLGNIKKIHKIPYKILTNRPNYFKFGKNVSFNALKLS